MITIFTPTYNRAYRLSNLFNSLRVQTDKNFEWLIVDDGSTDETEQLVRTFIGGADFNIRYVKQLNGGKHRAINRGIQLARGSLFLIVDSDDFLTKNAVEIIYKNYDTIQSYDYQYVKWGAVL